jgi:hypothetical protein
MILSRSGLSYRFGPSRCQITRHRHAGDQIFRRGGRAGVPTEQGTSQSAMLVPVASRLRESDLWCQCVTRGYGVCLSSLSE